MTGIGIHKDLSREDYDAIVALNSTTLKQGHPPSGSMLHLKAAIDGNLEDKDTKDRKFGRALHVRLLEPDRYKSEILVSERCCATKKDGERCTRNGTFYLHGEWYCGTHGQDAKQPEDYINEEEAARIEDMAKTLHSHDCQRLFKAKGWSEVSVVWDYHGHLMKSRLDRMSDEKTRTILDLKKAQPGKVHKSAMEKSILDYGWHRQAAIYVDGVGYETGIQYEFAWVFIEDQPPYDVGILRASKEVLDCGRFEYKQIISNWEYALEKGKFDGTNPIPRRIERVDDLDDGGLPGWYLDQFRNIETERSYEPAFSDCEGSD